MCEPEFRHCQDSRRRGVREGDSRITPRAVRAAGNVADTGICVTDIKASASSGDAQIAMASPAGPTDTSTSTSSARGATRVAWWRRSTTGVRRSLIWAASPRCVPALCSQRVGERCAKPVYCAHDLVSVLRLDEPCGQVRRQSRRSGRSFAQPGADIGLDVVEMSGVVGPQQVAAAALRAQPERHTEATVLALRQLVVILPPAGSRVQPTTGTTGHQDEGAAVDDRV